MMGAIASGRNDEGISIIPSFSSPSFSAKSIINHWTIVVLWSKLICRLLGELYSEFRYFIPILGWIVNEDQILTNFEVFLSYWVFRHLKNRQKHRLLKQHHTFTTQTCVEEKLCAGIDHQLVHLDLGILVGKPGKDHNRQHYISGFIRTYFKSTSNNCKCNV